MSRIMVPGTLLPVTARVQPAGEKNAGTKVAWQGRPAEPGSIPPAATAATAAAASTTMLASSTSTPRLPGGVRGRGRSPRLPSADIPALIIRGYTGRRGPDGWSPRGPLGVGPEPAGGQAVVGIATAVIGDVHGPGAAVGGEPERVAEVPGWHRVYDVVERAGRAGPRPAWHRQVTVGAPRALERAEHVGVLGVARGRVDAVVEHDHARAQCAAPAGEHRVIAEVF